MSTPVFPEPAPAERNDRPPEVERGSPARGSGGSSRASSRASRERRAPRSGGTASAAGIAAIRSDLAAAAAEVLKSQNVARRRPGRAPSGWKRPADIARSRPRARGSRTSATSRANPPSGKQRIVPLRDAAASGARRRDGSSIPTVRVPRPGSTPRRRDARDAADASRRALGKDVRIERELEQEPGFRFLARSVDARRSCSRARARGSRRPLRRGRRGRSIPSAGRERRRAPSFTSNERRSDPATSTDAGGRRLAAPARSAPRRTRAGSRPSAAPRSRGRRAGARGARRPRRERPRVSESANTSAKRPSRAAARAPRARSLSSSAAGPASGARRRRRPLRGTVEDRVHARTPRSSGETSRSASLRDRSRSTRLKNDCMRALHVSPRTRGRDRSASSPSSRSGSAAASSMPSNRPRRPGSWRSRSAPSRCHARTGRRRPLP